MSSSSSAVSNATVSLSSERLTGRVKWFNNKAGYGFVTVSDGVKSGTDIFVHHSSINVDSEQYKYLVQGEYVEFCLLTTSSGDHEFQAGDVCGIKGGKLMCETRNELKSVRTQYRTTKQIGEEVSSPRQSRVQVQVQTQQVKPPRSVRAPKSRGQGPREDGEWTQVTKSATRAPTTTTDAKVTRTKRVPKTVEAK